MISEAKARVYALPTLRELRAAVETLEEMDRQAPPRPSSVISSSAEIEREQIP